MAEVAAAAEAARGGAVERVSRAEARERLGGFADALALDQRASSRRTRELTGWDPQAPPIVDDVARGSYRRG
jgi:hypothetical protein